MPEPNAPISVNVDLRCWELYRVSLFLTLRVFRFFLIPVLVLGLIFVVLFAFILFNPAPDHTFGQLVDSFGASPYVVLGMAALLAGSPLISARRASSNPRVRDGIRFVFSDAGVEIQTSVSNSNLAWQAFTRAAETSGFLLLFVSNNLAHIVPKRCLADEATVSSLRELIRRHI